MSAVVKRMWAWACVATWASFLSGCASTSGVSDQLTATSLTTSKTSVVVMKAALLGHGCSSNGNLVIGKKAGAVYEPVKTLTVNTGMFTGPNDVMQAELPPGDYHMISFTCSYASGYRQTTVVTLGKKEGGFLGLGGDFKQSFASFSVQAGEIVNIGYLKAVASGFGGGVHISVEDLPAQSVENFRKDKPNLARQMSTRLMVASSSQLSPEQKQKLCAIVAQLNATLPPEKRTALPLCAGVAAAPAASVAAAAAPTAAAAASPLPKKP